ncbi:hypothetical protein ACFQ22_04690 [Lentilactobacillus raoultii]|uniref:Uncharacterized protein n=1 Tax=Lentilactobacillus raoultii TaxID=1987503 RepID=A0ABW3PII4_9LACO|nr:hypothetical protein [Lentilactobacillus raoultii]
MTLFAIFLDAIALGGYFFQLINGGPTIYLLGLFLQAIITIGLLIMTISFKGPHYANPWTYGWYTATFRYGIIVMSLAINAVVVFLYGLNYFGINHLIFSGFYPK